MKEILLAFDVNGSATAFRNAMFRLNYSKFLNTITNLPSGMLTHKDKAQHQAISDAENVTKSLNIKLIRCVAFATAPDWQAIVGEKI